MPLRNLPIRRKLMTIMLVISGVVVLLTCLGFFTHQLVTYRQDAAQNLSMLGKVIAANSTAALAFDNQTDAAEILGALKAEPSIVAAALYDADGELFARYPADLPEDGLPRAPGSDGTRMEEGHLVSVHPAVQGANSRLGTLYLKLEMSAMYRRLAVYGGIALLVTAVSFLVAYLLSHLMQQQVSQPILALAGTARAVSDRRDYSVRATKLGTDELGVLTDAFNHMLTQIEEQNRALREGEARLRAVVNSAISAVVVMDARGRVKDWNAQAEALFGRSREDAVGGDLADMIIPARYREAHRLGMARFFETGEGPVLNRVVAMSAIRADGTEFPVELSVSPLKRNGEVLFCGFITDITQRKEAESRIQAQLARLDLLSRTTRAIAERQDLKSIFQVIVRSLEENMPVDFACVWVHDAPRGALTLECVGSASTRVTSELGLVEQSRLPIAGNGLDRCLEGELIYEPDIGPTTLPFFSGLVSFGLHAVVAVPLIVERKVFGLLMVARRHAEGFSSGDCEFLRQLSEHVALAAHQATLYSALQQAYDDLRSTQHTVMQQERLRALGQMASGIAHDINNAISPVTLYTESLLEQERGLSPRARNYLETIQRSIEDVAETVARMREFYRQREPQLALAPVNLNQLARQVIDLTRARWWDLPQSQGVSVQLQTDFAPEVPNIMGAEGEIRDALTNLIFNAVDAMPEGGTLTVRTRVLQPDDDEAPERLCLEVCDTGTGMDEVTRKRCLEPFFTTKGERGTGLGLAMVYGMVERHSAELEIDSEPGVGTTMRLIFVVSAPVVASVVRGARPAPLNTLRILVVDDDPLLIKSLHDTLQGDGHAVTTADGGQAGIDIFTAELARGAGFDAVITDLGMPYVDGRRVAAAIKSASAATPVILLTGWGRRLLAEHDIPPHVDRVLNKPPRLNDLREALMELTARPAHAQHS